jgi:trehalose 6-phosphate synthase/phosphatase
MNPPVSALLTIPTNKGRRDANGTLTPVELTVTSAAIFSTSVGPSNKKTLASWHVQTPNDIISSMLGVLNSDSPSAEESAPLEEVANGPQSYL